MSDFNPAGFDAPAARSLSDHGSDDIEELSEDTPTRRDREGLPASYRMRADAHYVDQLMSRRAEAGRSRDLDAEAAARSRETEGDVAGRAPASGTPALLDELADRIAAIESAASHVVGDRSALARRAGVDVIRAEAWRAAFLLRAARLVDGHHPYRSRQRHVGPVLATLRDKFAPEFRLAGCQLHVIASDWNASADLDEAAFETAVAGAVFATLGVLNEPAGASVRITVKTVSGDLHSVEVAQDDVSVREADLARFFDRGWTERASGALAGYGAIVCRAFAVLAGGEVAVSGGRRGTAIRFDFERPF